MKKETRVDSTPESCSCSEEEEEEEEEEEGEEDEENIESDQEEIDYAELIEKNHLDLVTSIDLERHFWFRYDIMRFFPWVKWESFCLARNVV